MSLLVLVNLHDHIIYPKKTELIESTTLHSKFPVLLSLHTKKPITQIVVSCISY